MFIRFITSLWGSFPWYIFDRAPHCPNTYNIVPSHLLQRTFWNSACPQSNLLWTNLTHFTKSMSQFCMSYKNSSDKKLPFKHVSWYLCAAWWYIFNTKSCQFFFLNSSIIIIVQYWVKIYLYIQNYKKIPMSLFILALIRQSLYW